jgi:DNA-binding MarR family transcriptional regulator
MQEKFGRTTKGPMDVRVWLRLLSCAMTIEKRLRRKFADEFQTTLPRFDIMAMLDRHPEGQTMGELSRALLVSNGNVTAVVKQLQEQGLVISTLDPADRRSSIVCLSPAGKDRFDILAQAHHNWIHAAFADFPADKQKQLFELLADLKTSIAKE